MDQDSCLEECLPGRPVFSQDLHTEVELSIFPLS